MTSVAFDNTMLSLLLNPISAARKDPKTGQPVELAKERAKSVLECLERDRRKLILPAPACAELLTAIGPDAAQYLALVARTRFVEVVAFDARAASELAIMNRDVFKLLDDKGGAEPYQKIKVDRQIIATCLVNGASELYTDDDGLSKRAKMCGMTVIGIADVPIPEDKRQVELELDSASSDAER